MTSSLRENYLIKEQNKFLILTLMIIIAGILLRFFGLGAAPMTASEAANANAAFSTINSNFSASSSQPMYTFLTSLLFKFFGDSENTARLMPALFGAALLFLPFAFQREFSPRVRLLWLAFLALDPALIAWSKRADETIIAVTLAAYLLAALRRSSKPAIITLCAMLLASVQRSLPLAIAMIVTGFMLGALDAILFSGKFSPFRNFKSNITGRDAAWILLITLVIVTGFYAIPAGLGSFGAGIADAFSDRAVQLPFTLFFVVTFAFYFFQTILTIGTFLIGRRTRNEFRFLLPVSVAILSIVGLILRQGVLVFVWTAPAMTLASALAADEIMSRPAPRFNLFERIYTVVPVIYMSIVYLTVSVFIRFTGNGMMGTTAASIGSFSLPWSQAQQFFILAFALLVAVFFLVPIIVEHLIDVNLAKPIALGILTVVLVTGLANAYNAAGLNRRSDDPAAPNLTPQPLLGIQRFGDANLLRTEIDQISLKSHATETEASGLVLLPEDAAMHWALRRYPKAIFSPFPIAAQMNTLDFYLTANQPEAALNLTRYSGMELTWGMTITPETTTDYNWLSWLFYRNLPATEELITIWQKNATLYPR